MVVISALWHRRVSRAFEVRNDLFGFFEHVHNCQKRLRILIQVQDFSGQFCPITLQGRRGTTADFATVHFPFCHVFSCPSWAGKVTFCPLFKIVFPPLLLSTFSFSFHCNVESSLLNQKTLRRYHTIFISVSWPGPEVIKLFSCSTQLSMKFFLLINVKRTMSYWRKRDSQQMDRILLKTVQLWEWWRQHCTGLQPAPGRRSATNPPWESWDCSSITEKGEVCRSW